MVETSETLTLEILRKIQADMAVIKHEIGELKISVASLREDVHSLKGDLLRQERTIAYLDVRVERVEIASTCATPNNSH